MALPPSGLDMFTKRIAQALGHHSHGIQAQFDKTGPGTFFADAVDLMDGNDEVFLATSKAVADSLAKAHQSKSLAPSKLLIISGRSSKKQQPFSAVVKAELQDALAEKSEQGKTVVYYFPGIFFAESQRLYKIGFIQKTNALGNNQAPTHFSVHLFDHLMTGTETRAAAYYFYKEFLGADISASDRQLTKQFFDKTIDFFNSLSISPAKRIDLGGALRAELRSNDQTISVKSFGSKHLDAAVQPKYIGFMGKANFQRTQLRRRPSLGRRV